MGACSCGRSGSWHDDINWMCRGCLLMRGHDLPDDESEDR